jgi:type II secretory pathway component GspD/PulD (secretin)
MGTWNRQASMRERDRSSRWGKRRSARWVGAIGVLVFLVAGCAPLEESRRAPIAASDAADVEVAVRPRKPRKKPGAAPAATPSPTANAAGVQKLLQSPAASGATSKPSQFDSILKGMSSVLHSAGSMEESKLLVPDPTEPKVEGPVLGGDGSGDATTSATAAGGGGSAAPEGEAIATPPGVMPIALNLPDTDVRQVLEMLGREGSVNILVSSSVQGKVRANLQGMTFDEALDAVLRLADLVAHREGNNIFVYPAEKVPGADRVWKVCPLNYISAEDVQKSITAMKGLLSPVGSVWATQTDPADNRKTQEAIVVEDTPESAARVQRYVEEIDVPARQVLIQAYVLEVSLKDDLQHGVNFEEIIKVAGNTATLQTLGFANPKATQAFFFKIDGKNFDALVESLRTVTDAKTLAQPKLLVLNGQTAHIQVGEQLGYIDTTTQTTTAATQSVKFLDLGVVLDVTPRISVDGQITMNVNPQVSSGRINPDTELPEKETTEVKTDVRLEDGQGMVIGGLIREKDSDIQHKIPILGDLPYMGMLFQERKKEQERTEVIVALLPRIAPYAPCPEARDRLETIRATTPLYHGPLRRCPRPWEPSFRDALPRRGDLL